MKAFTEMTLADALAVAHELVPTLRERASRTEVERRLLPETERDLRASGLLRYLTPRRWGGMELPFRAVVELPAVLALGCASTSWSFHNFMAHSWMLAMYEPRAQKEIWGEDPDALIAAGIAFPQGRGRAVDGGFVISGHWNFCSGIDSSPWCMFAATIRERDDGPPTDYRMCLVPRGEYEVVDDWQVIGMCGTGSKSVRANEVFVPEHRALAMLTIRGLPEFPGAAFNPGPLYRVPLVAMAGYFPAASALGNAQAALDLTIGQVGARETNYTATRMADLQAVQIRVALAGAKIEAARSLLIGDCDAAWEDACGGRVPDTLRKLACKRNAAYAGQLCLEAVDVLHAMAGANGLYERYPIQRLFRDAHAIAGHISFSFDAQGSAWGAAALTGRSANPML